MTWILEREKFLQDTHILTCSFIDTLVLIEEIHNKIQSFHSQCEDFAKKSMDFQINVGSLTKKEIH